MAISNGYVFTGKEKRQDLPKMPFTVFYHVANQFKIEGKVIDFQEDPLTEEKTFIVRWQGEVTYEVPTKGLTYENLASKVLYLFQ